MILSPYSPFSIINSIDRILDSSFYFSDRKATVKEDNGNYTVTIEMPGFSKEDVKIFSEKGYLKIEGKNDYKEVSYKLPIPREADPEKISASLKHGLLTLKITMNESQKKTIELR